MYSCFICMAIILAAASWEFAATSQADHHNQGEVQTLQSSPHIKQMEPEKDCKRECWIKMNGPGSKPPKCEHKCRGCEPCIAVQKPEKEGRLEEEYTNYEPEGWVCKCDSSFFIP